MDFIKKLILSVRSVGLWNVLQTIYYSLERDGFDARFTIARRKEAGSTFNHPLPPGQAQTLSPHPGGARIQFQQASLEIDFLAPDLVRFSWEPGLPPIPYGIDRREWPPVKVEVQATEDGWRLCSSQVEVQVGCDGSLRMIGQAGKILRAELPPLRQGNTWIHPARLQDQEHIYGLGEQSGRLNLRAATRHRICRIWNSDPGGSYGPGKDPLYMPLPVYLGLHTAGSYLVFYENSYAGQFTIDPYQAPEPLITAQFEGGRLLYYLIPGPPAEAVERYTQLTGRPPLPPLWSLGYHQCRWGYKTVEDIRAVVEGFRTRMLPLSAIHLDIDYMDGYRVFTVDRKRFPDLPELVQELAEQGIRLVTIIDPGVKKDPDFSVYQEGLERGLFCTRPAQEAISISSAQREESHSSGPYTGLVWPGASVFPDFTNPQARAWWGDQYQGLLEAGVAGFWHDMNEPSTFMAWGSMTLPQGVHHELEGRGGSHLEAHNLYGNQMNRAGFEALRRFRPQSRPWILSRAGWVGVARYAWNWTADSESSWNALRMTLPTVLGLGLSGQPYSGPDTGGFNGHPSAELYLRWFQLASFLPFFRTHSAIGMPPREPWVYGEPYTSIIRDFLRLRARLIPYWYTLAWEAAQSGRPLARPLFWDYPGEPSLWKVEDAYFLGRALLVAPVLAEGAQDRSVSLPPGGWYSFWEDTLFLGPGIITTNTPLERLGLLVRAGSVLPTLESGFLALHLYAPQENPYQTDLQDLYSDAGDGYGPSRLDHFRLSRNGSHLTLHWTWEGEFPLPYPVVRVVLHGLSARRAWVDGISIDPVEGLAFHQPFEHLIVEGL